MDFNGKHVLVLGLARSGAAVARLLHKHGAHVVVNDQKPLADLGDEVADMQQLGIQVIGGGHPDGIVHEGLALVVKNPGIPYKAAPVRQALELGIPVVTEVEIASRLSKAPLIGITGSNGKTTTTTLVGLMLVQAQLRPVVAGNIGRALTDVVEEIEADRWLVAELSSFQLMGTQEFRPRIGALLNLYAAHLDYHGTMEEYRDAKYRMFVNQTEQDVAVLNWDMDVVRDVAKFAKAKLFPFSTKQVLEEGVFVKDGNIRAMWHGKDMTILPVEEVALKGEHHLEDVLAATAISLAAGATPEAIAAVARTFRGVEHRLEYVATLQEVDYYNDSKATNAEAASRAINSFPEKSVVLIAGGLDRGTTFPELVPVFQKQVKHLVTLGQSADKLLAVAEQAGVTAQKTATLEEAVQAAARVAAPGEVVLLSPACASWDMFGSFEERGSMFKKAVHTL
ncbi:MAG: UDP-N-acetylmuramoyl-L-alanine--D-glutamate ligase [Tumebacillaceae bacterium]